MDNNYKYYNDWIYGYKMFKKNLTNQYGEKFEIGKIYIDSKIDKGLGFHFCKRIEDTLILSNYGGYNNEELEFYEVCGKGKTYYYENDYVGIYDVYASEELKIIRGVPRNELIEMFLNMDGFVNKDRIQRFLSLYKLNQDEIVIFKDRFVNDSKILKMIGYYQEDDRDAFIKKRTK